MRGSSPSASRLISTELSERFLVLRDHAVNGFAELLVRRHSAQAPVVRDPLTDLVDSPGVLHAGSISGLAGRDTDLGQRRVVRSSLSSKRDPRRCPKCRTELP